MTCPLIDDFDDDLSGLRPPKGAISTRNMTASERIAMGDDAASSEPMMPGDEAHEVANEAAIGEAGDDAQRGSDDVKPHDDHALTDTNAQPLRSYALKHREKRLENVWKNRQFLGFDTFRKGSANDNVNTGTFSIVQSKKVRNAVSQLNKNAMYLRLGRSFMVALLCALLTFGYIIQVRNAQSSYDSLSEEELTKLLSETKLQVENLEERRDELTRQLTALQEAADKQLEAERIAQQNEETAGLLSGRLAAQGQGIIITITQGSIQPVSAAVLFQLIEELRNAGVEVMAINGIRIVTSTYVVDTDNGILCDGEAIAAPFSIKAIGDQQNLLNAVNISGGVGSKLKTKYGATVYTVQSDNVTIDEVVEPTQYQYATEVK